MRKNKLLPLLILGILALLVLLMIIMRPAVSSKPHQDGLWQVTVQTAQPTGHQPLLKLIGQIESPRETTLSAATDAFVASVLTSEGAYVQQGDLLATLDPTDEKLQLAQRQADVDDIQAQIATEKNRYQTDLKSLKIEEELQQLSNKTRSRRENLAKRQVGSTLQWDEARQDAARQQLNLLNRQQSINDHPNRLRRLQAQLARASALRDQAQLNLERTSIKAPFDGRVTKVLISPQDRLRTGDPTIILYDRNHIELRAQIPSRYLPAIRLGLASGNRISGILTLDQQESPVHLIRLAGAIGQGKGGVDGLFAIDSQTDHLVLGRSAKIQLDLPAVNNTFALPPQALYGQNRIYLINEGILKSVTITRLGETRLADGSTAFLLKGNIPTGSTILTTQLPNAVSGLKVEVTP